MKLPKTPALLIILALFLAPIFGGYIPLDITQEERISPNTVHFLIALPVLIAAVFIALRETVVMIPSPKALVPLALFWIVLFGSAVSSQFHHESALELCKWTVYLAACFVCVASLGRTFGPIFALAAWIGGCVITGTLGIWEYIQNAATTPNWRVFAGWHNPNAAAGMLSVALPVGIILAMSQYRNRATTIALSVGCGVILVALWLTASKGGLASASVGLFATAIIIFFQRQARSILAGWPSVVLIAFVTAALLAVLYAPSGSSDAGGSSRLFVAGAEAAQSVGFRASLWRDTWSMALANPLLGVGLGAFGAMFPRYATTQGSALAHNSYLQLASEIGIVGFVLIIFFVGAWLLAVCRSNPGLPGESNAIRIAIVGSVFSAGANAMVESSFSYFGFGISAFALFGIGLLLASDGARPERSPFGPRAVPVILISALVATYLALTAINDQKVIAGAALMRSGDYEAALATYRDATAQPLDATPKTAIARLLLAKAAALEGANRNAEAKRVREEALQFGQDAVRLRPNAATYALLADTFAALGINAQAESQYGRAISLSPSNPLYRRKLFQFLVSTGQLDRAEMVARQLIAMEETPFFKERALPWLVNLDTLDARMFLAQRAKDSGNSAAEIQMLEGAYRLLLEYRQKTYSELMRITAGDERLFDIQLAGQSVREAMKRFDELKSVAGRLRLLYTITNREREAELIERQIEGLSGK